MKCMHFPSTKPRDEGPGLFLINVFGVGKSSLTNACSSFSQAMLLAVFFDNRAVCRSLQNWQLQVQERIKADV